ncbi:unnamed protein product [Clonostachys rosea f. rosea IK726]|uniref:Uncharacterized protein n=1 Tax=Clonostachys rosea f. rosea IK726 TaxID=1349383 RepID=A0ACA9T709_BIOOC|nr:unnamed protein product [Clonostachys rosea f. rosea IK726]
MPSGNDQDPMQSLVDSFRSLLDEPLIVAIATDHDLTTPEGYQTAKEILSGLSQSAVFEEATGFNATGVSNIPQNASFDPDDDESTSATVTSTSNRVPKSLGSASEGTEISSSSAEPSSAMPSLTKFSNDSDETKFSNLRGMFTELKEIDIKSAMKKANGDLQVALDILLNIQFLEATGQREKGIDGFFQPDDVDTTTNTKSKKKQRKAKKRANSIQGDTSFSPSSGQPVRAKNIKHEEEIAFIADRIDMSYDQVSDIFYRKRCSSGATVMDILDQFVSYGIQARDAEGKAQAKSLAAKYRNIPDHYLLALVQVTSSISQFSDDIAGMLSKYFVKNPWVQRIDLDYRLTPLPSNEIEGAAPPAAGNARTLELKTPMQPLVGSSLSTGANLAEMNQKAQASWDAKRATDAYTSQLLRKGGSNSLYKQAAAVYRERSYEQAQNSHMLSSAAAELLVQKQSTSTSIDLHGVSVLDGIRIARQRVQSWWDGLGESRVRKAREQSLTVVTGIGRHSAGGVSRLRQGVAAALFQDGWKMRIETGRFVITGRR